MIELRLKCKCTDGEVKYNVRERLENEDIADYMEYIQKQVTAWHLIRGCSEIALEYMKIPIANRDGARIGDK